MKTISYFFIKKKLETDSRVHVYCLIFTQLEENTNTKKNKMIKQTDSVKQILVTHFHW